MSAHELIQTLDRERDLLVGQEGRDFLLALPTYLRALEAEPDLGPILRELETTTTQALTRFREAETALIEDTIDVRRRLATAAPEIDDSSIEPPDPASHAYIEYEVSLASFDNLVERDPDFGFPHLPDDSVDPGPVSMLLIILRGRLRVAQFGERDEVLADTRDNQRPELNRYAVELRNLQERHDHAVNDYRVVSRTDPGLALNRLTFFAERANPEPEIVDPEASDDWFEARLDRLLREMWSPLSIVQKAVAAGQLSDDEQRRLENVISRLRKQVEVAHEGLVRTARQITGQEARRRETRFRRVASHVYDRYVVSIVVSLVSLGVGILIGRLI